MTENSEQPLSAGQYQAIRGSDGRFVPGQSGNVQGRRIGRTLLSELEDAAKKIAQDSGTSFGEALMGMAWDLAKRGKSELLSKLCDKMLPSKTEVDMGIRPIVQMPSVTLKDGSPLEYEIGDHSREPKKT